MARNTPSPGFFHLNFNLVTGKASMLGVVTDGWLKGHAIVGKCHSSTAFKDFPRFHRRYRNQEITDLRQRREPSEVLVVDLTKKRRASHPRRAQASWAEVGAVERELTKHSTTKYRHDGMGGFRRQPGFSPYPKAKKENERQTRMKTIKKLTFASCLALNLATSLHAASVIQFVAASLLRSPRTPGKRPSPYNAQRTSTRR